MASTARKRIRKKIVTDLGDKEKVEKKVSLKKTAPNKDKVEFPSHLSSEDLRHLENFSKDAQIAKFQMATEEQALRNMILETEMLSLKMEKQRTLLSVKNQIFGQKKVKYAEYKASINPKYGLKEDEPLGYNPDTGLIVR